MVLRSINLAIQRVSSTENRAMKNYSYAQTARILTNVAKETWPRCWTKKAARGKEN